MLKRRPTRSALYVPADHAGAMQKAASLACDILIFDLEDGVSPAHKAKARQAIREWFQTPQNTQALKLVRLNHRHSADYALDIPALAACPVDGLMLSKCSGAADIEALCNDLATFDRAELAIWCNVERPLGIANAFEIATHPRVAGMVAGTNDLANDLRIIKTPDRAGLIHSLQRLQLAARAYGKPVLDGTFISLDDMAGLEAEAKQGRMLGFDGKTLIHPKQIGLANRIFSPSDSEMEWAKEVIRLYEVAIKEGKAVTLMHGQMIERLHYERAQEMLALSRQA